MHIQRLNAILTPDFIKKKEYTHSVEYKFQLVRLLYLQYILQLEFDEENYH